jgi:hypothetical protein
MVTQAMNVRFWATILVMPEIAVGRKRRMRFQKAVGPGFFRDMPVLHPWLTFMNGSFHAMKNGSRLLPMRLRQIMRRGTWLYGGSVEAAVAIVRQNYFEGPQPEDEPPTPGYPPVDEDGCFYGVEYAIPGAGAGSGSQVFVSLEEAVRHAETTIESPIAWEP